MVGTAVRADGDAHDAGRGQRFDEAGLAGELVGLVSEQVRDGRRAQPLERARLRGERGRLAPADLGQRVGALAEQLRVGEQVVQLIVQLVEALTVPSSVGGDASR